MKKLITSIIALTMIISMVGCGSKNSDDNSQEDFIPSYSSQSDSNDAAAFKSQNTSFSLDSTLKFHGINIPCSSSWTGYQLIGAVYAFNCPYKCGYFSVEYHEYDNASYAETCMKQRYDILRKDDECISSGTDYISGKKIYVLERLSSDNYNKEVLIAYGNKYYLIVASTDYDSKDNCYFISHLDEMISLITFDEESTEPNDKEKEESSKETKETKPVETETEEKTVDNVSLGMKNALSSAKDYLDYSSFSYSGLIEQLEYEKYTHEEAVYAAENCGADWNEQAALTAQSYMDYSSFSRQELIDQLIFEGFTEEQAEYGVKAVGY